MKKLIALLAVLVVSIASIAAYASTNSSPEGTAEDPVEEFEPTSVYCYMGLDKIRKDDTKNNDMVLLAQFDHDRKEIKTVSVYRKTLMELDDEVMELNKAYSIDGAKSVVDMLESNLDLDVEGYIASEYDSSIKILSLLDGIEEDIDADFVESANKFIDEMNEAYGYSASHIEAGEQKLNGVQVIGYARALDKEKNDIERADHDRDLMKKIREAYNRADEETKENIIELVLSELYTDMNEGEIEKLAGYIKDYKIADETGFPEYRKDGEDDSVRVVPDDLEKNVVWLHEYFGEDPYEASDDVKEISKDIEESID